MKGHIGSNEYGPSYVIKVEVKDEVFYGNGDHIVNNCMYLVIFSIDMSTFEFNGSLFIHSEAIPNLIIRGLVVCLK